MISTSYDPCTNMHDKASQKDKACELYKTTSKKIWAILDSHLWDWSVRCVETDALHGEKGFTNWLGCHCFTAWWVWCSCNEWVPASFSPCVCKVDLRLINHRFIHSWGPQSPELGPLHGRHGVTRASYRFMVGFASCFPTHQPQVTRFGSVITGGL